MKMTDYTVGYGKPPTSTRFKKGVCPNKKGRPRKVDPPLGDLVDRAVQSTVPVLDGRRRTSATRLRVAIQAHVLRALAGDIGSAATLLNMREEALRSSDYGDTIRIRLIGGMPAPRKRKAKKEPSLKSNFLEDPVV
jgi:hypothetical protein